MSTSADHAMLDAMPETATKTCVDCHLEKPLDDFPGVKTKGPRCKPCHSASVTAWRKANPERRREHDYKRAHGGTIALYDQLLAEQDGHCAICPRLEAENRGGRLFFDHDHETGEIRGLLCSSCNRALGLLGDDVDTLDAAAVYLRRYA